MWIFAWIILSVIVAFLGKDRSCGFLGALLLSLLFRPIIGILIVIASKRKKTQAELLNEAKTYKDTGIINENQYKEMVTDIMNTGKCDKPDYYINKPVHNPDEKKTDESQNWGVMNMK